MDFNEEILLRKLKKLEDDGIAGAPLPPGYYSEGVANVSGDVSGGIKHWGKSVMGDDGRLRVKQGQGTRGVFWDKAPIIKRTERARAESMANRMWKAIESHNPGEMVRLLQIVQGDNWAKGRPVSFEDVKQAAIDILKKEAAKAKLREGK